MEDRNEEMRQLEREIKKAGGSIQYDEGPHPSTSEEITVEKGGLAVTFRPCVDEAVPRVTIDAGAWVVICKLPPIKTPGDRLQLARDAWEWVSEPGMAEEIRNTTATSILCHIREEQERLREYLREFNALRWHDLPDEISVIAGRTAQAVEDFSSACKPLRELSLERLEDKAS